MDRNRLYVVIAVILVLGLAIGYFVRDRENRAEINVNLGGHGLTIEKN